jgi:hypothetical protein
MDLKLIDRDFSICKLRDLSGVEDDLPAAVRALGDGGYSFV